MMPRTDGDAFFIKSGPHFLRAVAIQYKGQHPRLVRRGTDKAEPGDLPEEFCCIYQESMFVLPDQIDPDMGDVVDGNRPQSHRIGNIAGTRFPTGRSILILSVCSKVTSWIILPPPRARDPFR